jgi:hypothetical protein
VFFCSLVENGDGRGVRAVMLSFHAPFFGFLFLWCRLVPESLAGDIFYFPGMGGIWNDMRGFFIWCKGDDDGDVVCVDVGAAW